MKIRNLTPKVQELKLAELPGGREFSIYVEGHGVTEIQGAYPINLSKLRNIFEVVEQEIVYSKTEEIQEESVVESSEIEEETEVPVLEDKFICEICGAEFASARGLASHKNRSHAE